MKPKNKGGRPSLYKEDYPQRLIEYFGQPPYRKEKREIYKKGGEVLEIEVDVATDFPTLAGFAIELGVSRDTLHEWSKVHKDFSDAYKRAKDYQERYLTVNSLKGIINPTFAIFTAKNVIGWRDVRDERESDVPAQASVYKLHDSSKPKPVAS